MFVPGRASLPNASVYSIALNSGLGLGWTRAPSLGDGAEVSGGEARRRPEYGAGLRVDN